MLSLERPEASSNRAESARIAVVVPAYRVREQVLDVLAAIGPEAQRIVVVDDGCPENSGKRVMEVCRDPRVEVCFHEKNEGVGGATMTGYRRAIEAGCDVVVKVDGDGQMDPADIPRLVRPLLEGEADYVKGNRFWDFEGARDMPAVRWLGNLALSFGAKLATGYWNLFDPTNGYTAIHARVVELLPFDKIDRGYFFESDLLFRLNTLRAAVVQIPMRARYGTEKSSLKVHRVIVPFAIKNSRNFAKRLIYGYFLRSFSIASIYLVLGAALFAFGLYTGLTSWARSAATGVPATAGTVMLASLPIIVGVQLLLAFLAYDIEGVPKSSIHKRLR